jgi:dephospho-CoA kinase
MPYDGRATVACGRVGRCGRPRGFGGDRICIPEELDELEAITHPEIERRIEAMLAEAGPQPCAVETPVPGLLAFVEATRIAIVADDDVRFARAVSRGGSFEDVRARMASQVPQDVWRAWADVSVDNSGAWADTERAVVGVIEELMSRA